MVSSCTRLSIGAVALLGVLLLALGVAACGDSDDDGGGATAAAGASAGDSSVPAATVTGSDEEQIRQTLSYVESAYVGGDGKGLCNKYTEAGQQQIVRFAKLNYGQDLTCPKVIAKLVELGRYAKVKNAPAKTVAVKVDGDKAVATVSDGGRPPAPVRLVKDNGEWKIPDPGYDTTASGPIDE